MREILIKNILVKKNTFFLHILSNAQRNTPKKHVKDINIFLKKKKTKGEKNTEIDIEIFSMKKKQKLREYMKKYYLTHKIQLLGLFKDR